MIDWAKVEQHARQQASRLSSRCELMGELKRRLALTIDLEGHYTDWKMTGFDNIANPPERGGYKLDLDEQNRRHKAAQEVIAKQRAKRLAEKGDRGSSE